MESPPALTECAILVRSWSGGHVYGDIAKCSSFFEDADVGSSSMNSVDEYYFEDSLSYGGNTYDDDEFHSIDTSKALIEKDTYVSDTELNFATTKVSPKQTTKEFNEEHKSWIRQLQRNVKEKKQVIEKNALQKVIRTRMQQRLVIKEAQRKGKVGYNTSTKASDYGKIDFSQSRIVEEHGILDGNHEDNDRKIRRARRHKNQLKEYINRLRDKREMEAIEMKIALQKLEETKRNVTRCVLSKMRRERDEPGIGGEESPKENSEQLDQTRKHEEIEMVPHKKSSDKFGKVASLSWGQKTGDTSNTTNAEEMKRRALFPSEIDALTKRLTKRIQEYGNLHYNVRNDYDRWKFQNGVPKHQKVFSMTGFYPAIRDDFFNRGWFLNDDRESKFFDFKFTLSASDIDFENLSTRQIVNHFKSSVAITTKVGLIRTLDKAPFFAVHCSDKHEFFPRSYDLTNFHNLCSFIEDYIQLRARAILNRVNSNYDSKSFIDREHVNVGVIDALCRIVKRYSCQFDGSILVHKGVHPIDTLICYRAEQWINEIVEEGRLVPDGDPFLHILPYIHDEWSKKRWNQLMKKLMPSLGRLEELNDDIINIIKRTLDGARSYDEDHPQETINGNGTSNNLWIIKPGDKSRGRGIHLFQNLEDILRHIQPATDGAKASQFVVQKYIENPLLIQGRKFDIRQWILVTDWNPITIWFYDDCYIRFAVEEYEVGEIGEKWNKNKFKHLVNNSIIAKSKKFNKSFIVEETNSKVDGCMWTLKSFREWLLKTKGENVWDSLLKHSIQKLAIDSILCAQEDIIIGSNGSFEVYGLDIMIDESLHPWLIEINSSPACSYSTSITETFVKKALPDILKVILKNCDSKHHHHHLDLNGLDAHVGGWERIFQGSTLTKLPPRYGSDITVKGIPLRRQKTAKTKQTQSYRTSGGRKSVLDTLVFDDSDLSDHEQQESDSKKKTRLSEDNKENREAVASSIKFSYRAASNEKKTKLAIPLKTVCLELDTITQK